MFILRILYHIETVNSIYRFNPRLDTPPLEHAIIKLRPSLQFPVWEGLPRLILVSCPDVPNTVWEQD